MKMKVFTVAHMPEELAQKWLQHLRDFDTANPGCHFEVASDDPPDMPVEEMLRMMQVEPALTFAQIFERKKP